MNLEIIWPFFAELSLKVAAVFLLGVLVTLLLRRTSAEWRHRLWMPLLTVVLIAPLLLLSLPRWQVVPDFWTNPEAKAEADIPKSSPAGGAFATGGVPIEIKEFDSDAGAMPTPPVAEVPWAGWRSMLIAVWLIGLALLLLRLSIASARLAHLQMARHVRAGTKAMLELLSDLQVELDVRRPVRLLLSKKIHSPFAWGIFRPVIALPVDAEQWCREDLEMVLRHEMAHLSRNDGLAALITRLAVAVYWMNPLAWWTARRVTELREEACDRLVLAAGCDPQRYAQLLFEQARQFEAGTGSPPLSATAAAESGTLEQRVKMILNSKPQLSPRAVAARSRRRPFFASLIAIAGLAVVALGLADDNKKAKPSDVSLIMEFGGDWFPGSELAERLKNLSAEDAAEHVLSVITVGKVATTRIEKIAALCKQAGVADMMLYSMDEEDHLDLEIETNAAFQLGVSGKASCAECHSLSDGGPFEKVARVNADEGSDDLLVVPPLGSVPTLALDNEETEEKATVRVTRIYPVEGDTVEKGQTLVNLPVVEVAEETQFVDIVDAPVVLGLGGHKQHELAISVVQVGEYSEEEGLGSLGPEELLFELDGRPVALEDLGKRITELPDEERSLTITAHTPMPANEIERLVSIASKAGIRRISLRHVGEGDVVRLSNRNGKQINITTRFVEVAEDDDLVVEEKLDFTAERRVPLGNVLQVAKVTPAQSALAEKLQRIVVPSIEFVDTPLAEALEFLRMKSEELDSFETELVRKGVNVVLIDSRGAEAPSITLKLKNVPLSEALRYTAELSQLELSIEGSAVVLRQQKAAGDSAAGGDGFGFGSVAPADKGGDELGLEWHFSEDEADKVVFDGFISERRDGFGFENLEKGTGVEGSGGSSGFDGDAPE